MDAGSRKRKSKTGLVTERPREFISFNWERGRQQLERSYPLFSTFIAILQILSPLRSSSLFTRRCDNNNTYSLFQKLTPGFLHALQMQLQQEWWGGNPLHSLQLTGNGLMAYLLLSLPRRHYRLQSCWQCWRSKWRTQESRPYL